MGHIGRGAHLKNDDRGRLDIGRRRAQSTAAIVRRTTSAVTFPGAPIRASETSCANAPYDGYYAAPIYLYSPSRNRRGALFLRQVVMRRAGIALVPFARHAYSIRHLVQLL